MDFGIRFKTLLKIFNLNSRKLAIAIHVDPSSISRWINNKRPLPPNNLIVDKIIDYILNMNSLDYQKSQLYQLISPNSDISALSEANLVKKIKEWLFAPAKGLAEPAKVLVFPNDDKINKSQIKDLLASIKQYTDKPEFVLETGSVNNSRDVFVPAGETKTAEIFHGKAGMQQAMLRLAVSLLKESKPREILVTCQDNFIWFKETEFLKLWMDLMNEILKKGHKIKIIYNLSSGLPEVMYLIHKWLPLITTGNLEAYYYPKYEYDLIRTAILVVPGVGCLHSMLSEEESAYGSSFFYSDYGVTEYFRSKFEKLITSAKKLIYLYSSANILSLHEELTIIESNPGCRFVFRNGLTSLTIPIPLYKELLKKSSLTKTQQQRRLSLQMKRLEIMKSKEKSAIYRDICPIEALEEMSDNKNPEYALIDIFSSGLAEAQPSDVVEHMKNTIEMLKNNSNYEIALVSENEIFGKNTMYLALKEDTAALISSWDSDGNPLCILIKENMVVNAFEEYFQRTWEQIPRDNRDKERVIKKLQNKILFMEQLL